MCVGCAVKGRSRLVHPNNIRGFFPPGRLQVHTSRSREREREDTHKRFHHLRWQQFIAIRPQNCPAAEIPRQRQRDDQTPLLTKPHGRRPPSVRRILDMDMRACAADMFTKTNVGTVRPFVRPSVCLSTPSSLIAPFFRARGDNCPYEVCGQERR